MKIEYNVTGADRKALVAAMSEILEVKGKYLRVPTCAYQVGDYMIRKDGAVECEDGIEIASLIQALAQLSVWMTLGVSLSTGTTDLN